ncbi:MAG TPA: contractile injection system protein, VgrG/Pvc8 family [Archangium sp.]|uniref:phage late control D family protein n=1 Tax=Archangium sp. TaxID=1872627 RepID=UPI002E378017|nr:contractile injection system protein, VgrG/Pvc8 family [Archangium sp.]HEX5749544.1 contractile injection system protein, VgrG/Pvc8 family [Archangium sp.]
MADGTHSTPLRPSRPTFHVGGQEIATLGGGLLALTIEEDTGGLYRCEATFGNWGAVSGGIGFLYFDRKTLDFGKGFQVRLGRDTLFDGRISALEGRFQENGPPEVAVLAEDRLQDLRMTRRTRTFEKVSDADVLQQLASKHGLGARVDVQGPQYDVLAQVNQSDLAFLRERCRAVGAEVWVEDGTLHAQARPDRASGTPLTLTHGSELREFTVLADLAGQRTSVSVSGWDVRAKTALKYTATDSVLGAELDGGTSGASLLSSTLGDREEVLVHTVPLSLAEARARAESFFRLGARRFVTGRGTAWPTPGLRVGVRVELKGLGKLFSGKYYVTGVKHLFDATNGLRTEFTAERPGLGR